MDDSFRPCDNILFRLLTFGAVNLWMTGWIRDPTAGERPDVSAHLFITKIFCYNLVLEGLIDYLIKTNFHLITCRS